MAQHQEQPWADESSALAANVSSGGALQPLALPHEPMAPISDDELPVGSDWGYQLKWDGVRILARLDGEGHVELFSRKLYLKNGIYPEMVSLIASKAEKLGRCLLDGEIVWFDGVRPSFQHVLKRERSRSSLLQSSPEADGKTPQNGGLVYVLFDLLADESGDLRQLPYEERHRRLLALCPADDPRMFVTELFKDGAALWDWVQTNSWEGVVSKRLSSPYREDKKHRDWLKKKIALVLDVDIVGLKWRNGIVASLVMEYEGGYLGSVSLGLNDALRRVIASTFRPQNSLIAVVDCPFPAVPEDLRKEEVQWLSVPFKCRVTGLEFTSAGQLRHPKLVTFLPKEPLP
ncbi:bifunctional non-homologous end joining protein LigD [Paenibacillus taihuensis]|uniref:Bifunctional non-homologous end joining protein LigD n=1 Tax=Paenibacillus taihuensis TaxID=1156355 RepID=A0A3D9QVN5_9BACL|nr:DNA ligase [Paenibacillus taihuensis]REE68702.1 bifunctional non-homologous end joining protein LigD [Paenibacillus taihuensis]